MIEKIAWINGKWGSPHDLKIPIEDRALNLGDGIFETILIWEGKLQLFNEHLERWKQSALLLGMESPPDKSLLQGLIKEGIKHLKLQKRNGILRLNWSRGDNKSRGIDISDQSENSSAHRFWMELSIGSPSFKSITAIISSNERRNTYSLLSRCKTFAYTQSVQARREAKISGFDDALLLSNSGELCCGTTSNLIIMRNNEFLTPRLKSGCLPGIMRQQGLNSGLFKEGKLEANLHKDDECLLINSLSCHPIKKLNNNVLKTFVNAENLWKSIYKI